ncbi:PPK2 family polyphosphate kinase [Streptomyces sp. ST2-7A]|uniref:PPK2 family polyphosphate kinase n=1 Tax=Streptomyces sp. ST2-7A TaxID=2907214 RepID=UPI001F2037E4|nr:PPK2 family polyphosphate kinase [Streptomyces sp. ST2-7A]MCE7082264.1 polyphosphate kinase 2 family protein [Streptomyces sp. ST2-7A]
MKQESVRRDGSPVGPGRPGDGDADPERSIRPADTGPALRDLLRLPPGEPVDLAVHDTSATPGFTGDKARAADEVEEMGEEAAELQERLHAASTAGDRRRLLLVLQGMDTSGKGGTVKHVISRLNPAGCRIRGFKAPTEEERSRHYLWRIGQALPMAGEIGIFDRSHYEDVLVPRVRNLVPAEVVERRYTEIRWWEESLVADGLTVVKVFLHIGREEQRERLLKRLNRPDKHWKFTPDDIADRALWPDYRQAYEVAMERCSSEAAPWYLVPADRKWYRNWAVGRLLLEHLREIDPRYPAADFDLDDARSRLGADS